MLSTVLLLAASLPAYDRVINLHQNSLADVRTLAARAYANDAENLQRFERGLQVHLDALAALARDAGLEEDASARLHDVGRSSKQLAVRRLSEEAEEDEVEEEPGPTIYCPPASPPTVCYCPPSAPAPPFDPPSPPEMPAPPFDPPLPNAPPPPGPDPLPPLIVTVSVIGWVVIPSILVVFAVCICGKAK